MKQLQEATIPEVSDLLQRPTLTLPQTAKVLGVGETALRNALRRQEIELPVISVGTRKIIPTAAVKRLLVMDEQWG